jgi:signal transduction histidine kinase/tetratricopeptide (TPR) repeat protein
LSVDRNRNSWVFINNVAMNKMQSLTLIISIAILGFSFTALQARENVIDSLETILKNHIADDTVRVNLLNNLAINLLNEKPDEALHFATVAYELASSLNNYSRRSISLGIIGDYYYKKADYNRANNYYVQSTEVKDDTGYKLKMGKSLHFIGLNYNHQGDLPTALEYYQKALVVYNELDNKKGIYRCLIHFGILYLDFEDYIRAKEYFKQALSICEELDDKPGISVCLNNIGNAYTLQADYSKALELFNKALSINRNLGNKKSTAVNLGNIGEVFYHQGKYQLALNYFKKSLDIYSEIDNKTGICYSQVFMGAVYLQTNNFKEALFHTLKGLELATDIKLLYKQKEIYKQLSDIYASTNDFKSAYQSYVKYKEINDSIFNEEIIRELTSIENSYEFEKEIQAIELEQQKKDAIKAEEDKLQKNVRNTFIAGFILMVLLVAVVFRNFMQKRKANNVLAIQKKEIEDKNMKLIKMNDEIKTQSQQLKSASEKLIEDEQFVTMGKLIAGISHEVNTPLGIGVTGSSLISNDTKQISELLKNEDLAEDELVAYLEKTKENSDIILSNLIKADNHIGGLKRISRDQISEIPRKFMFLEYLNDIIQNLKHEWKNMGVKEKIFNVNCPDNLEINSLPGAISQIFTNLIMNSIRHGFTGQENFVITISVKEHHHSLVITYEDNGVGIKKEYLPHKIFKAFFTTKLYTGGSGLGLYIVKDLVEKKLNGTIDCESNYGNGIKFTIAITLLN